MNVALYGAHGKVGVVLEPALVAAGHDVADARETGPVGRDAAVDFTTPDAVVDDVAACLAVRVPVVIGTTGFDTARVDALARDAGVPCFFAPNFALGAVLLMRFAAEAARSFPRCRDRGVARRDEARRSLRHGQGDGRADGHGAADPLRPPPGPRRAPGGHSSAALGSC